MLERLRSHIGLLSAISLVVIGSLLFVVSAPFVTDWLEILSLPQAPGHPPTTCQPTPSGQQCTIYTIVWVPPNPWPLFAGWAIATPLVLALAWWIRRSLWTGAAATTRQRRWARAAVLLLGGSVAWVDLFILSGFVMDWLSIPILPWIRYAFLASLLVAASLVLSVGAVYLISEARRGLSGRSRADPG